MVSSEKKERKKELNLRKVPLARGKQRRDWVQGRRTPRVPWLAWAQRGSSTLHSIKPLRLFFISPLAKPLLRPFSSHRLCDCVGEFPTARSTINKRRAGVRTHVLCTAASRTGQWTPPLLLYTCTASANVVVLLPDE